MRFIIRNPVALVAIWLLSLAAMAAQEEKHDTAMDFFKGDADVEFPAPAPLLANAKARSYRSLNGEWPYVVDESGMSWNYITKHSYYDGVRFPDTGHELKEISFDDSAVLTVPGDWNSQAPELDRYRGRIVYYKALDMAPEEGKRYFLHFDGANYTTDLFVNNELVGRHIGGYTAFNFDVTDHLKDGKNTFIVRVNAHLDETTVPTMRTSDFWKYGGLIRDVGLITVEDTYIGQYQVYLQDHTSGEIRGWVQVEGADAGNSQVKVAIDALDIALTVSTDSDGRGEFSVRADELALWSPDSPHLYDVDLQLGDSTVTDRVGFRTVATDGTRILLNGEPIRLRGIAMHDESLLHPGMANSEADARASLELVRELNANFVRLAHYPHNEHTLKLADELGIMVWSEVPIVSLIDWQNPDTLSAARQQIIDNVNRDRNRAAIIMWSVSNESFPQTQARLDFLTTLAETARNLDASNRPIASALVGGGENEFGEIFARLTKYILKRPDLDDASRQKLMAILKAKSGGETGGGSAGHGDEKTVTVNISDPLGEVVDIVGYNEYFGWYYGGHVAQMLGLDYKLVRNAMLDMMADIRFTNSFGKPMIISEFGAGAKAGLHSDDAVLWSEEYQAKVYRAQLPMLDKSPQVQGYSPWVLKDFRSHLRNMNAIQETYNRKGLVSETGEKKQAFRVLADHYREAAAQ